MKTTDRILTIVEDNIFWVVVVILVLIGTIGSILSPVTPIPKPDLSSQFIKNGYSYDSNTGVWSKSNDQR